MKRQFNSLRFFGAILLLLSLAVLFFGCGRSVFKKEPSSSPGVAKLVEILPGQTPPNPPDPYDDDWTGFNDSLRYYVNLGAVFFSWRYFNKGDYDQSGAVASADVTPIAAHYGHKREGTWHAIDEVIDGSGNGDIESDPDSPPPHDDDEDFTYAPYRDRQIYRYGIEGSEDQQSWAEVASKPQTEAENERWEARLEYEFNVSETEPHYPFYRVVAYDYADENNFPSKVLDLTPQIRSVGPNRSGTPGSQFTIRVNFVPNTTPLPTGSTIHWNFGGGATPQPASSLTHRYPITQSRTQTTSMLIPLFHTLALLGKAICSGSLVGGSLPYVNLTSCIRLEETRGPNSRQSSDEKKWGQGVSCRV